MKNGKSFIILGALVFLFFALNVDASNYWVRPTGTMSGCTPSVSAPGTDAGYKSTINAGLGCLASGDSLFIRTGTYSDVVNGTNIPSGGGSWATATTISGYSNEVVTLTGGVGINAGNGKSYIIFNSLILDASVNDKGLYFGAGNDHLRFSNGEVKNSTGMTGAGMISGGAYFCEVINSSVHGAGSSAPGAFPQGAYGFYMFGVNNCLFEGNRIYDNGGAGLNLYHSGIQDVHNNIVRNNIFYNNGLDDGTRGNTNDVLLIGSGNNNVAYNNIIYGNVGPYAGAGISLAYGGSNTQIYNNTIYGNRGIGIQINPDMPNSIIKNNIVDSNGASIVDWGASGTVATNNLCNTAGPGCAIGSANFVNAGANNFHLQASSLNAINRGATISLVTTDIDGVSRPQGIAYDIGAYEYAQTSSTPGSLQFNASSYGVNEGAGNATITVTRTGGSSGIVGATVSTSDGTATAGSDYTTTSAAVSFGDGSTTAQTVSVPITEDSDFEGNETVNIALSAPTGGATLGSPASAVLTIVDNDSPVVSGIVGLWTFNEASGTAGDTSGQSNTGTLTNGATRTTGIAGNALSLDGVDDYVSVADSNSLDIPSTFTLSAWVNPSVASTTYAALIAKSGGNHVYFLFASAAAGDCANNGPIAGFHDINDQWHVLCHGVRLTTDSWTMLTIVNNGTSLILYRDAQQVASMSATGNMPASTGELRIGASQWGEYFAGKIDDVRVYNTALTQAEIQAIYNSVGAGSLAAPTNLIVK